MYSYLAACYIYFTALWQLGLHNISLLAIRSQLYERTVIMNTQISLVSNLQTR